MSQIATQPMENVPLRQPVASSRSAFAIKLSKWLGFGVLLAVFSCGLSGSAYAQAQGAGGAGTSLTLSLGGGGDDPANVATAIQVVVLMTLITLAPSFLLLMTSFTRIVIVLGFIRGAIGLQGAPSNQILVGMSLFLSMFIMTPTAKRVNEEALQPYLNKQINTVQFAEKASIPMKGFMIRQSRPTEVDFFLGISGQGATKTEDLPMTVVIPAFILSELRTAFQMGFLLYVPFLVIDFLVSATLMSMGMMMMPPMMISLPFKLLLFVLVDGWHLVVRSLVQSFVP
jgi:flagellar biosynthetic protein FliP